MVVPMKEYQIAKRRARSAGAKRPLTQIAPPPSHGPQRIREGRKNRLASLRCETSSTVMKNYVVMVVSPGDGFCHVGCRSRRVFVVPSSLNFP